MMTVGFKRAFLKQRTLSDGTVIPEGAHTLMAIQPHQQEDLAYQTLKYSMAIDTTKCACKKDTQTNTNLQPLIPTRCISATGSIRVPEGF